MISALAKGSDRIVAKRVLQRPDSVLQAVFPMDLEEYSKDFSSDPADLREFEALRARDPNPTVLGVSDKSKQDSSNAPESQEDRTEKYYKAGIWVVERCEILVAVWNGKPARGRGGTGDAVAAALRRGRRVFWINADDPEAGAQVIVPARNKKSSGARESTGGKESTGSGADDIPPWEAKGLPRTARELSRNFHQLSAYNRDRACDDACCEESARQYAEELKEKAEKAGLHPEHLDPVIKEVVPRYARADALAVFYQKLHRHSGIFLYCLAAFAVTTAVVQHLFFLQFPWLILLEVLAMIMALVLLRVTRAEGWHQKWLFDRQLAEQYRTVTFTSLLGERPKARPDEEPKAFRTSVDAMLPFYRGPEGWILDVSSRVCEAVSQAVGKVTTVEPLKSFLVTAWIEDQAKWHESQAVKNRRARSRAHGLGLTLFIATLLLGVIHAVSGLLHSGNHGSSESIATLVIVAFTVALPAWGAAVHAITSLREYERIAMRSERLNEVLLSIADEARRATTMDDLWKAIAETQRLMAMENHEWLISLSFRPLGVM
jgi:hypothetical protein